MTISSNKAYAYLIKILSARDYSEYKLREKLRVKNYPADEIDCAINEIKARGFLREQAFAEGRVKGFMDKGYSPDYIRLRLAEEHLSVTDDEIQAVFTEYRMSTEIQIDCLIRKKFQGKMEFDFEGRNKVLRYLLSKGHDLDDSKKVINAMISQNLA